MMDNNRLWVGWIRKWESDKLTVMVCSLQHALAPAALSIWVSALAWSPFFSTQHVCMMEGKRSSHHVTRTGAMQRSAGVQTHQAGGPQVHPPSCRCCCPGLGRVCVQVQEAGGAVVAGSCRLRQYQPYCVCLVQAHNLQSHATSTAAATLRRMKVL